MLSGMAHVQSQSSLAGMVVSLDKTGHPPAVLNREGMNSDLPAMIGDAERSVGTKVEGGDVVWTGVGGGNGGVGVANREPGAVWGPKTGPVRPCRQL